MTATTTTAKQPTPRAILVEMAARYMAQNWSGGRQTTQAHECIEHIVLTTGGRLATYYHGIGQGALDRLIRDVIKMAQSLVYGWRPETTEPTDTAAYVAPVAEPIAAEAPAVTADDVTALLLEFVSLAVEIAQDRDMPLIEALDEAAHLWPQLADYTQDAPACDVLPFEGLAWG